MTTTRGPGRPRGLLAYPAQSNFTGVQHPLHWIELGHERGYDVLRRDRAPPGPAADVIHERVRRLSEHLLSGLTGLRHGNGAPMVRIYGPTDVRDRGGTVTLNVLEPQGVLVDERLVAAESAAQGVSLRTGCFCNPGAGEGAFDLTRGQLKRSRGWGVQTIDDYLLRLDRSPVAPCGCRWE